VPAAVAERMEVRAVQRCWSAVTTGSGELGLSLELLPVDIEGRSGGGGVRTQQWAAGLERAELGKKPTRRLL
jgi:hypothetical protein